MDRHKLMGILHAGTRGPLQASSAVAQAVAELEADDGSRQIHAGGNNRPLPGSLLELAESPSQLLVVPTVSVAAATTTVAAVTVDFSGPGYGLVIGMMGAAWVTATGVAAPLESMGLRFNLNGKTELVTDGAVQAFACFATLFRGNALYLPFRRLVASTDRMNFFFRNSDVDTAITPELTIFFLSEEDLAMDRARFLQGRT